jgi:hypothetical protein
MTGAGPTIAIAQQCLEFVGIPNTANITKTAYVSRSLNCDPPLYSLTMLQVVQHHRAAARARLVSVGPSYLEMGTSAGIW